MFRITRKVGLWKEGRRATSKTRGKAANASRIATDVVALSVKLPIHRFDFVNRVNKGEEVLLPKTLLSSKRVLFTLLNLPLPGSPFREGGVVHHRLIQQ